MWGAVQGAACASALPAVRESWGHCISIAHPCVRQGNSAAERPHCSAGVFTPLLSRVLGMSLLPPPLAQPQGEEETGSLGTVPLTLNYALSFHFLSACNSRSNLRHLFLLINLLSDPRTLQV